MILRKNLLRNYGVTQPFLFLEIQALLEFRDLFLASGFFFNFNVNVPLQSIILNGSIPSD